MWRGQLAQYVVRSSLRLGVSSLSVMTEKYYRDSRLRPARVSSLVLQLARDDCDVVRSFVRFLTSSGSTAKRVPARAPSVFAAFHDPPPTASVDETNGHLPLIDDAQGEPAQSGEPLLTPGSAYELPSSIDWSTNTSLLDEDLSEDGNLSDESFGTLNIPWPDADVDDPFADPPSRPGSPQWMLEPRIGL